MGEVCPATYHPRSRRSALHRLFYVSFRNPLHIFRCRNFVAIIFSALESLAMAGIRNRFSHAKRLRIDPSKWSPIKNMICVIRRQKQQHRRSRQQKWNYFGALPKTKQRTEYFFWQNNEEGNQEDAITNCKSLHLAIKTVGGPRTEVKKKSPNRGSVALRPR